MVRAKSYTKSNVLKNPIDVLLKCDNLFLVMGLTPVVLGTGE